MKPQGYVNDFAGVINPESTQELNALCTEVDHKAQAQIAVVTVKSLEGEPIEEFSIDLATRWGIGPRQKDRGVMILLAPNDRQYRFEVGYGLEPILPDGLVGGFGRQARPLLREGNYGAALLLMTQRVAAVIAKDRGVSLEALAGKTIAPEPESRASPGGSNLFPLLIFLFILFFPLLGLLARLLGGRSRYGRGHGVWWWGGPWFMGGGSWRGGSWGGGGFGSGGGFGGFGGGSFGGGGASGGW